MHNILEIQQTRPLLFLPQLPDLSVPQIPFGQLPLALRADLLVCATGVAIGAPHVGILRRAEPPHQDGRGDRCVFAVVETAGVRYRSWFGVGLQMAYSVGCVQQAGSTHTRTRTHTNTHIHGHTRTHTRTHIHTHTCTHTNTHTHTHTWTHTHAQAHTDAYTTSVRMHVLNA